MNSVNSAIMEIDNIFKQGYCKLELAQRTKAFIRNMFTDSIGSTVSLIAVTPNVEGRFIMVKCGYAEYLISRNPDKNITLYYMNEKMEVRIEG